MLRRSGFAALAVLFTFLASSLVAAPAHAELRTLTTSYTCDSSFGGGTSAVTVKVDIPARVKAGRQVDARRINFKIVVPDELADTLRDNATAISATATAKYRVGAKRIPIRNLEIPRTEIPAEGDIVIRGSGRAGAFTIDEPGRYAVKVPKGLAAVVKAYGTPIGTVTTDLTCALADGAPAKLATLRVVR
jgi:hypothetical protein